MDQIEIRNIEEVGDLAAGNLDQPFNLNPLLERAAATLGVEKLFLITFPAENDRPKLTATAGFTIGEFRDADAGLSQPFWTDLATKKIRFAKLD